jgi:Protein of unknown function (DUF3105)
VASRKHEKERLRQRRLEAERRAAHAARRRLYLGYAAAALLAGAVVAGLVVVIASGVGGGASGDLPEEANIATEVGHWEGTEPDGREGTAPPELQQADLEVAARAAGCDLRLDLPDEGAEHATGEDPSFQEYDTNPPTSGSHFGSNEPGAGAMADGAYLEPPPLGRTIHSMEHSRVEIQYSPELPEQDQLLIKGIFDEDPRGMLLFPNPDMPYQLAVTAWTNLVGCKEFDERAVDVIRDFRDTFRGQGPEAVPF